MGIAQNRKNFPSLTLYIFQDIRRNMMMEQAKEMLEIAKQEVHSALYAKIKNAAVSVKNEVLEMIERVQEKMGRLALPIVSAKYLAKIPDRDKGKEFDSREQIFIPKWQRFGKCNMKKRMIVRKILLSVILLMAVAFVASHYNAREYSVRDVPIDEQSFYELASTAKAFTALGILQLEKDGKRKLTDPVDQYISCFQPKFKGKSATITIEQLLEHTSGIPEWTICLIPSGTQDNSDLYQVIERIKNIKLNHEPGKVHEYATINYDVLEPIIHGVK